MAQESECSRLVLRSNQSIEAMTEGGGKQRGKKQEHLSEGQRKTDNNNNCVEQLDLYKAKEQVERLTLKREVMKLILRTPAMHLLNHV